jgi:hypothetical protein
MKKTVFIITVVALALASPLILNAAHGTEQLPTETPQQRTEQHRNALAPEKAQLFDKIIKEHTAQARPLQRDLKQKFLELEYVSRLQKAEVKDVTKILDEIKSVKSSLHDLKQGTADRIQKETGIAWWPGRHFQGKQHQRIDNGHMDKRGQQGREEGCRSRGQEHAWGHNFGHDHSAGWGKHNRVF